MKKIMLYGLLFFNVEDNSSWMCTGFELIASWSEQMVESSLEMAELENSSPHEAKKWILFPILSPNM